MTRVAPIKLQYNPRVLWFDPQDLDIKKDDPVVVKTARGTEFGHAASDIIDVDEEEIKSLKSPLKPVLRLADEDDLDQAKKMSALSQEALPVFKEMAVETGTDMRPVSVEYLFDGDKAVFYFESEERVDFRELVRRLASHFHIRVDMRQIGVRDEARMIGGLGHCGQELCCCRLGGEFCPVSIRMAKEQDLSLNPQKISGVCGRLMCCLRYEYEAYKDFKSRAPKQGAMIETSEGQAKVVELYMPKEQVSIKTEEGKVVKIPLSEMEQDEGAARPNRVSADTFEFYANHRVIDTFGDQPLISPAFTGKDKLGDHKVHRSGGKEQAQGGSQSRASSRSASSKTAQSGHRKPRRRTAVNGGHSRKQIEEKGKSATTQDTKASGFQQTHAAGWQKQHSAKAQGKQAAHQQASQKAGNQFKKHPNQSRNKLAAGAGNSQQKQQKEHLEKSAHATSQQERKLAVRPGQKSSGLRSAPVEGRSKSAGGNAGGNARTSNKAKASQAPKSGQSGQRGDAHRTARRRSHKAQGQGAENSRTGQGTDQA